VKLSASLLVHVSVIAAALNGCSGSPSSVLQSSGSTHAPQRAMARPAAPGTITEFAIPTSGSAPLGIIAGPDGALWFSEATASQIGRVTTKGKFKEYPTPTSGASPAVLTLTTDPNFPIWFTENAADNLALMTLDGSITEVPIPKPRGARPNGIAAGPPGNEAIWFTNYQAGNSIGSINSQGKFSNFSLLGPNANPAVIVSGPDQALWFTEQTHDRIGRISIKGAISEYVIRGSRNSKPYGIALGPDQALWFTLSASNKIGRIATNGRITLYLVPTPQSAPTWIAAGPDNALWFTESAANNIGRIDPSTGVVTEYTVPTAGSCPTGIAAGPDNAMWFTENCGNNIGRISTS
jgi:virginiamycin B lyase